MHYRNLNDLVSREGIEVEAGSLWKCRAHDTQLCLADNDQFATVFYDPTKFAVVH